MLSKNITIDVVDLVAIFAIFAVLAWAVIFLTRKVEKQRESAMVAQVGEYYLDSNNDKNFRRRNILRRRDNVLL